MSFSRPRADLDHPGGDVAGPGRPARRSWGRDRAGRPGPGARPGPGRGSQPPVDVVRDGDRSPGACRRPRLRPGPRPPPAGRSGTRPAALTRPADRGSRSRLLITAGRRAGTGPGGSPPGSPGSGTCSSRSGLSRWKDAITGTRPAATIPGSCSGTWPRSGMRPAPGRAAVGRRHAAISSTAPRTRRAAGPVCATGTRSAASTTALSRIRGGAPSSSKAARSGGPPHPAGSS